MQIDLIRDLSSYENVMVPCAYSTYLARPKIQHGQSRFQVPKSSSVLRVVLVEAKKEEREISYQLMSLGGAQDAEI